MSEMRRPKHARRLAYRLSIDVLRRGTKDLAGATSVSQARSRLAGAIEEARRRYEDECPANLRGTWFEEAFDVMIDRALHGLPLEIPKPHVAAKPRKKHVEPLPELPPIVDGGYRDAPRRVPERQPRGPLVADLTPKPPLFPEDPGQGARATIKLCGFLLAIGQAGALVWALGTHASRGAYLSALIIIAVLFGTPILIARADLSAPSD
ncbi:MAG: hypothetical protein ACXWUG_07250 [Polyangiales bacterium]